MTDTPLVKVTDVDPDHMPDVYLVLSTSTPGYVFVAGHKTEEEAQRDLASRRASAVKYPPGYPPRFALVRLDPNTIQWAP